MPVSFVDLTLIGRVILFVLQSHWDWFVFRSFHSGGVTGAQPPANHCRPCRTRAEVGPNLPKIVTRVETHCVGEDSDAVAHQAGATLKIRDVADPRFVFWDTSREKNNLSITPLTSRQCITIVIHVCNQHRSNSPCSRLPGYPSTGS